MDLFWCKNNANTMPNQVSQHFMEILSYEINAWISKNRYTKIKISFNSILHEFCEDSVLL